jgi:hypothetical protein
LLLTSGSSGGIWIGNGINSSTAAAVKANASIAHKTALGYGEASALGLTTFAGEPIDSTSLVIQYTFFGDANLDGQVDVADLGMLASHWQSTGVWTRGDFDYSGFVNVSDLGLLASNWQAGAGAGKADLSQTLAAIGLPDVTVPEPLFISLLVFAPPLMSLRSSRLSRFCRL